MTAGLFVHFSCSILDIRSFSFFLYIYIYFLFYFNGIIIHKQKVGRGHRELVLFRIFDEGEKKRKRKQGIGRILTIAVIW